MDLEEEAAAYAAADFADVNEAFVERLLELAGPVERVLALDLGTGPADVPLRLWRRRAGWTIVAADVSRAMLDLARPVLDAGGATRNVWLLQQDAKTSPLKSGAFDIVFSNSILHHVSDTARFWTEAARVARPGSLFFVRDLARPASESAAAAVVARYAGAESALLREEFYRSLLSAYTVEEVRAQLAVCGIDWLRVEMSSDRHLDIYGRDAETC